MDKSFESRFWSKVDKNGPVPNHCPDIGPCWIWTACTSEGYGHVGLNGRVLQAHRVAWTIAFGDPGIMCVCHKCDNPSCVNPNHLFLGKHVDNMRDKEAKGRGSKLYGLDHPNAKLSSDDVRDIRLAASAGASARTQAAIYGVDRNHIHKIVSYERRGDVW